MYETKSCPNFVQTNVDFFAALFDLRLVQCGGTLKMQETLADCELDTTQILYIVDLKCFSIFIKYNLFQNLTI